MAEECLRGHTTSSVEATIEVDSQQNTTSHKHIIRFKSAERNISSKHRTKLFKSKSTTHIPRPVSSKMADVATPTSSSPIKSLQHSSSYLHVSQDEESRGRKRRRSSNHSPPPHLMSNASATFRGRARRRSRSVGEDFERIRSPSPEKLKNRSPGRKYLKRDFEQKRRSQSPSRSRTRRVAGGDEDRDETVKPRRRQRTRSRSRKHSGKDGKGGAVKNEALKDVDEQAVED